MMPAFLHVFSFQNSICNTIWHPTKKSIPFLYLPSYDVSIKATGRYFTEFLQNVDNIHSQFRLSYPKMKSPSMYVTQEDERGCILVYRSGRHGFTHYLMGERVFQSVTTQTLWPFRKSCERVSFVRDSEHELVRISMKKQGRIIEFVTL